MLLLIIVANFFVTSFQAMSRHLTVLRLRLRLRLRLSSSSYCKAERKALRCKLACWNKPA